MHMSYLRRKPPIIKVSTSYFARNFCAMGPESVVPVNSRAYASMVDYLSSLRLAKAAQGG